MKSVPDLDHLEVLEVSREASAEDIERAYRLAKATYADDFADMAKARKHSTIRQAATIARDAGALQFVATHFSTRYEFPRMLRQMEKEGREVFPDLVMAEDLTKVEVFDRDKVWRALPPPGTSTHASR